MSERKFSISGAIQAINTHKKVISTLCGCALLGMAITFIMYNYTQRLLKERLQERLVAIVSTAATTFESSDVLRVRTENDMDTKAYERMVMQLEEVRDANRNILYAYIMRQTAEEGQLEFVADAEGLIPFEEQDFDGDGEVEEDEMVPIPGDPFDASEYPELRDQAFFYPVAAAELEQDAWSTQLSAYAPIWGDEGEAVAIMGVDVEVTDYQQRTQETFLPFILFVLGLIFLLTLLTLTVFRYQSERVKLVEQVDRQKDELLSMVSHQLATPVTSMKFSLEMMEDGDAGELSKDQEKMVATMYRTVQTLSDLVHMILDVSRIQLGRMKVQRAELDLNLFFDDIVGEMQPAADEKSINFVVKKPKNLPKEAMLDRRLLRMTLENLLSNAIKYTPEKGDVTLTVQKEGDVLTYKVKDTGCGIPKEDQKQLFGKMFRASNVRNTIDGNGFGLYIAKGAVEAQNGTIEFDSEENKGTTFTVVLPLSQEEHE